MPMKTSLLNPQHWCLKKQNPRVSGEPCHCFQLELHRQVLQLLLISCATGQGSPKPLEALGATSADIPESNLIEIPREAPSGIIKMS